MTVRVSTGSRASPVLSVWLIPLARLRVYLDVLRFFLAASPIGTGGGIPELVNSHFLRIPTPFNPSIRESQAGGLL